MPRFIKKKELLVVVFTAAAAFVALLFFRLYSSPKAAVARVTFGGAVIETIVLSKDAVYHIDANYPVTLEVKDGAIRFINSVCPNHDCEGFGWIKEPPEVAVCLPARVAVQIID